MDYEQIKDHAVRQEIEAKTLSRVSQLLSECLSTHQSLREFGERFVQELCVPNLRDAVSLHQPVPATYE